MGVSMRQRKCIAGLESVRLTRLHVSRHGWHGLRPPRPCSVADEIKKHPRFDASSCLGSIMRGNLLSDLENHATMRTLTLQCGVVWCSAVKSGVKVGVPTCSERLVLYLYYTLLKWMDDLIRSSLGSVFVLCCVDASVYVSSVAMLPIITVRGVGVETSFKSLVV